MPVTAAKVSYQLSYDIGLEPAASNGLVKSITSSTHKLNVEQDASGRQSISVADEGAALRPGASKMTCGLFIICTHVMEIAKFWVARLAVSPTQLTLALHGRNFGTSALHRRHMMHSLFEHRGGM